MQLGAQQGGREKENRESYAEIKSFSGYITSVIGNLPVPQSTR